MLVKVAPGVVQTPAPSLHDVCVCKPIIFETSLLGMTEYITYSMITATIKLWSDFELTKASIFLKIKSHLDIFVLLYFWWYTQHRSNFRCHCICLQQYHFGPIKSQCPHWPLLFSMNLTISQRTTVSMRIN